jgi:NADPH:quinone reductase-like Zn-dependent oxidoreductase
MRDGCSYQEKDVPMTTKGNEGQSALVTGASGGIGLELARVLAANLFSLVLLARSRDKLEDLAHELGPSTAPRLRSFPPISASPERRKPCSTPCVYRKRYPS